MVLELGPRPAAEADGWTKFARRIIIELRSNPEASDEISSDVVDLWCRRIDEWAAAAIEARSESRPFRWSESMEPEVGEFLLHGLDRCLHSTFLRDSVTPADSATHKGFTMHVVQAFVDGLSAEGESYSHYVDQVLTSFSGELET